MRGKRCHLAPAMRGRRSSRPWSCRRTLFFLFCLYAASYHSVAGMHQKRGAAEWLKSMPPEKRAKADVTELFLSNRVSGERASGLFRNMEAAGVKNLSGITRSYRAKTATVKNADRDLRTRLLRHNKWPKPYYIHIDCLDLKTGRQQKMWVPMWLPHEIVHCLSGASSAGLRLT